MSIPALVVRLAFEAARVEVRLEGVETPEDCSRLGLWIGGEPRWHALVLQALALAQPRLGDLEDDELLERLAAELAPAPDPYREKPPWGTFQAQTLAQIVAKGEAGREWIRWATSRPWPAVDAAFADAVRRVAALEGLLEPDAANGHEEDAA